MSSGVNVGFGAGPGAGSGAGAGSGSGPGSGPDTGPGAGAGAGPGPGSGPGSGPGPGPGPAPEPGHGPGPGLGPAPGPGLGPAPAAGSAPAPGSAMPNIWCIICRSRSAKGSPAGIVLISRSVNSGPGEAETRPCIRSSSPRNSGGNGSSSTSGVSSRSSAAKAVIPAGPSRVSQSTKAERSGTAPNPPGCDRIGVMTVTRNNAAQRRSSSAAEAPSAVPRSRASRSSRSARSRSAGSPPRRTAAWRAHHPAIRSPHCARRGRGPTAFPADRVQQPRRRTPEAAPLLPPWQGSIS